VKFVHVLRLFDDQDIGFEQDSSSHAIPDSSIIRHISRLIGDLSMRSAIAR